MSACAGNVLSFGNSQGRQNSPVQKVLLEGIDAGPFWTLIGTPRSFVERDQVDFELHSVKQTDQPFCIFQGVGQVPDEDVLEGDAFAGFQRIFPAGLNQFFKILGFIHRHQGGTD